MIRTGRGEEAGEGRSDGGGRAWGSRGSAGDDAGEGRSGGGSAGRGRQERVRGERERGHERERD